MLWLPRRTPRRVWRFGTAVVMALAMVVAGLSWAGTAAAAPPAKSPSRVQPPGDGGWKPATPPKSTTVPYKAKAGPGGPRVVKPDPKAKRVKELTDRRTANASYFQMSDGSVQQEVSAVAVHYRDAKGAWQSIDSSVKPLSHDGFTLGAQGNSFQAYFSANASSLLRLEQGPASVQLGADAASSGAPRVSGSSVVYAGAYPGADLSYQVGPDGVTENIVLAKAPAAGQSYAFTLTVGAGLVPRQLKDGAIELAGGESGAAVFTIPAPYMTDAKKDASSPYGTVYSRNVSQTMSYDAASGIVHVTVTPDAGWLADAKRVYPVRVDPTIVVAPTPSTAANTMIQKEDPNGNNSTSWRLSVGTTTNGPVRSLIKFPLPAIPPGTTIASADLALYYDQVFYNGAQDVPMQALQANAPWTPATATWANANTIGGPVAGAGTMKANVLADWVHFPVTSAVQNWVNGTANNGFVLKATNEATLGQGGPRFEGSIYAYGGEVVNYPKLVITYGVPGVAVNPPSVIHATGAELSWPAYTNTTGDPNNDAAEYQVHRSVNQTFTPGQATLVSPVAKTTTSFVDSTAVPTPANSSDPYGNAYYYMVVVKTKGGALIAGPTQLVRLPKAGRTTLLIAASAAATLSSKLPTSNLTSLVDSGVSQPWLEVGDNSGTYGTARAVFDFGALSQVPTGSRIIESHLKVWQETTSTNSSGAVYELHGLTRSFTGTQVTWNSAATGTAWTTAGGDFSATVGGTVSGLTNDPNRQTFDATSIVQGWITTPSSDHGLLVKLKAETSKSPQERTIFAGRQTAVSQLAPQLVVTYLDTSTAATYYAPSTPTDMVVGQTYTTPVTINNTTSATWAAASEVLTYHWLQPDGTDVTAAGNQLQTRLPSDLAPGATVTLNAQVTPPVPTGGNESEGYSIGWDMYNTSTGTYLSGGGGASTAKTPNSVTAAAAPAAGTSGPGSLKQQVSVDPSGNNQLGLEHFYQYVTTPTGSGTNLYTNVSSGNTVWNYDILSNPSLGFDTTLRLSYNSLSTFDTGNGFGWSIEASTPTRLGQALQFNPTWNNPTEVVGVDGTGNAHKWTWNATTGQWVSPPGVHLYLQKLNPNCSPQSEDARGWSMTRPDRTVYYFNCAGYPTSTVDKNGNEADFIYSQRQSENKPDEFLTTILDPMSRPTLTLTYYQKGDPSYSYVDPTTWTLVNGTNLTAPGIVDSIKSITDVSGRTINFYYTPQGLLGQLVDGANAADGTPAKTFNFTYDMTQGMKNVKMRTETDPLGHTTGVDYYPTWSPSKWMTQAVTDRLGQATTFTYLTLDSTTGASLQTNVNDANLHPWAYQLDSAGRMVQTTDPNTHTTKLAWDTDNNVKTLTEANNAVTSYTYDSNTGYPLTQINPQEAPASIVYTYRYSLGGHVADLTDVTSAAGRRTHYGIDDFGNVVSVQQPNGTAMTPGGPAHFVTVYDYDLFGRLVTVTDANGHATTLGYRNFAATGVEDDPTGLPTSVKDPLGHVTTTVYGSRGETKSVTDPNGAQGTQNYDVFSRPTTATSPKDHTANPPVVITYPGPQYDGNDNVLVSTGPTGAVTTNHYDKNDQLKSTDLPDNGSGVARQITYTYDSVGNQKTVTEPVGTALKDGSYTTTFGYDDANQLTTITDAMNHVTTIGYDNVGNKHTLQRPKGTKAKDASYTTTYDYDKDHRQFKTTDPQGNTTKVGYDPDGLTLSTTDQNGATTTYSLDQNGRVTQVQVPHTGDKTVECGTSTSITCNTTGYSYDEVGNLTAVSSPRSYADGVTAGSFTTVNTYNDANQRVTEYGAYDASLDVNNRYGKNFRPQTDYTYDADGRVKTVTQWVREPDKTPTSITSTTDYFDTGWIKRTTDPFNITTDYDYNDLGQQALRKLTPAELSPADADVSRQMKWTYYHDGSLASSTDSGLPNGWQDQILTADSATAWASGVGCSPGVAGTGYNGSTFYDCDTSFSWNITVPNGADGAYSIYVWVPKDAQMPSGNPAIYGNPSSYFVDDPTFANAHVDITQADHAGSWVQLTNPAAGSNGKWTFKAGMHTIEVTGGVADAVRVVRNDTGGTGGTSPQPPVSFTFQYDANGNQHVMNDLSPADPATAVGTPTAQVKQYLTDFDPLDRPYQLQELKGAAVVHKLVYGYDDNGNLKSLTNDEATNTYDYDTRDALIHVSNQQSVGGPVVNTGYSYFPNGQRETQTKGNDNAVSYSYNLDGTLSRMRETTGYPQFNQVDVHDLTYDANNNISQDVFAVGNADQPAAALGRTRNFLYSPNNQLTWVNKESDTKGKERYDYDSLGEITKQTLGDQPEDQTVDNTYDRGRLVSSTPEQTDYPTTGYQYDAAGRMTVVGNRLLTPNDPSTTFTAEASQQYRYDGFDNIVYQASSAKLGTADQFTSSTTSAYDSLNRAITASSFVNPTPPPDPNAPPPDPNAPPPDPNAGKIGDQTFDYLATSKTVNTEQTIFAAGGTDTKTYDYDPSGERLAMEHSVFVEPPGSNETLYYTYDPHQDVEALTGADGFPVTTYGYTAYGQDDRVAYKGDTPPTMDSGRDKPTQGPDGSDIPDLYPLNTYRFNSARQAGSTGNLDMGFRTYNPGIGQFLNRDSYTSAGADAGLAGGRYGFGGGNPLSNIELDGHISAAADAVALGVIGGLGCLVVAAATAGVGGLICAVAVGAMTGYAYQNDLCAAGQGSCSGGALGKAALIGAVGGLVGGLLGVATAAVLPEAMAGWAAGAIAGGVGGAGGGAAGYGTGCALGNECSWSGLGKASLEGAAFGTAFGAAFGALDDVTGGVGRGGCSFSADTKVQLADGDAKVISDLKPGDKVKSTDTTTGKTKDSTTSAVMVNHDTNLYDLTVRTSTGDRVIHTTANHPFYDQTTHSWVQAAKLHHGDQLTTDDGTTVTVEGGAAPADSTGDMWDLTVPGDHDFYVLAGDTPVLVHNADSLCPTAQELRNSPGVASGRVDAPDAGARWLRGSHGNAGRIPGQIADQLRGQTFNSFDDFREAFWTAVGNDPDLSSGFSKSNVTRMKAGNAPRVVPSQRYGGGLSYVLHHLQPIQHGGGVYDMDNIAVVTPLYHSQVLAPSYHYGNG